MLVTLGAQEGDRSGLTQDAGSAHWLMPPSKCLTCEITSSETWFIKKRYGYTVEYYSAIKKNETMPFAATWIDLEINILSKVRQRKTNTYHLYVESKKVIQMNLFTKQKETHRHRKQTYAY